MVKKLPKIINQEEFEKLFAAVEKKCKSASKKRKEIIKQYKLAMLLGFEAGLRISEVVGLKELKSRCCKTTIKEDFIEEESNKRVRKRKEKLKYHLRKLDKLRKKRLKC